MTLETKELLSLLGVVFSICVVFFVLWASQQNPWFKPNEIEETEEEAAEWEQKRKLRLKQELAAMIAAGWFNPDGWKPGTMLHSEEIAGDALELAQEIISQSEKSDSSETQKPDPK